MKKRAVEREKSSVYFFTTTTLWCHLWGHFGIICEVKIMPISIAKIIVFSRVDVVGFWRVSGCIFVVPIFDVFSGLATTDRETPRYVKFVDSIENLADFQEN